MPRERRLLVTWDVDEDVPAAEMPPGIVNVPHTLSEEGIADVLSDEFGWCVLDYKDVPLPALPSPVARGDLTEALTRRR